MVVLGQKWLYSVKVVVFGKELLYSGKGGCIRPKWLYSFNVVVFGQKCLFLTKVVLFVIVLGQKWL